MNKLYVQDQLQSLHVNYNNWSDQEWKALQPIWDYVDYLGSIPSTDPAYNQAQEELKRLYTLIAPLNKPQPVPGAFAELKKLADQIQAKNAS